jgi:uncharacterized protein YndB with AHSA1/START domain
MTNAATLRIERAYQAPAQAVFDAWTSEEVLRRWFHAGHDWETTEAEVELRLGGVVRVVMRDPQQGRRARRQRPLHRDRPAHAARVHLDLGPQRLIELDFEETDGITTARFTHSGLLDEEAVRSHEYGWNKAFENLERTLQATDTTR